MLNITSLVTGTDREPETFCPDRQIIIIAIFQLQLCWKLRSEMQKLATHATQGHGNYLRIVEISSTKGKKEIVENSTKWGGGTLGSKA